MLKKAERMLKKSQMKPVDLSSRQWNNWLLSSQDTFTSLGEGISLALIGNPSSDGVTQKKIPYGLDVLLNWEASNFVFPYWVG